jgi:transcriptional regulator with XRE-family HTH domain
MSDMATDWYGPDTATFGDRVAGAREAAGLTQAELARKLGVRKDTILAWEEDRSEPRANKLSMLAGVLNVSIVWLLTGEGDGASVPGSEGAGPDLSGLLSELRVLRADLSSAEARATALEGRLARMLAEPAE